MVEAASLDDIKYRTAPSSLPIMSPEYQAGDPGLNQCPRTHGTAFQRHIEGRSCQSPTSQAGGRLPDHQDLRMGRRILHSLFAIVGGGNHFIPEDEDRPYRHLAHLRGLAP